MSLLSVKVARKTREAEDIAGFALVALDGQALPPFEAGSHVDVHVGDDLVRQYSLCNDPAERHRYLLGVLRDPATRGGSRAMHDNVKEGDVLRISAPKNHFALAAGARESLLLAGGIGVTPIMAMAERLAAQGANFAFHYGARSVDRMAFRARILGSPWADKVRFHFDDGAAEQKFDLAALLRGPAADRHLYFCGPIGFLDAVRNTARALGWCDAQVHFEYFSNVVAPSDTDTSFEVELKSSGRVILVGPDQSVTEALAKAGVDVPTSCEQGVCGTCITRVLEGEPDHKDMYFTPDEHALNDQFTPCCSRAKSKRLVLDL